jgi:hypothetical protein
VDHLLEGTPVLGCVLDPEPLGVRTGGSDLTRVLRLVLAAATGLALSLPAPPAGALTALSCGAWQTVASPPGKINLTAVAAVASNDVWAAGQTVAEGGLRSLVEHWNGNSWTKATLPASTTYQAVNGLAALAPGDVWTVGYASTDVSNRPYRPLVMHWDGSAWTVQPSLAPAGADSSALVSVTGDGAGGLLAVGYAVYAGQKRTLVERFDGTAWSVLPSPSPGTEASALLDVVMDSPSTATAVGYRSDGFGYHTLVERWDGTGWTVDAGEDPADVDNVLTSVAAPPSGPWSVGYAVDSAWTPDAYRTLVQRRAGESGWRGVPSSDGAGTASLLDGVSFSSADDGWAVGARYSLDEGGYRPLIEHWDGTGWTLAAPDPAPTANQRLRDVAVVPGTREAWAVGRVGIGGLIQHYCPTAGGSAPADAAPATASSSVGSHLGPRSSARTSAESTSRTSAASASTAIAVHAVDMAAAAGIAETVRSYGAAVTDYDGDGWPDIATSGVQDPAHLYRNDAHGGFVEPNPSLLPRLYRLGCAWADVNLDGRPDLFCGASADSGTDLKANELWIQQTDHSFVDRAAAFGVADPLGRARHPVFADLNRDGAPDLWIGNQNERPDGLPSPNRLFLNVGGTRFVDAPSYGLDTEEGGGIGPAGDLTGDGNADLVSTGDGLLHVYRNDGGGLTEVTGPLGLSDRHMNAVWIDDFNKDGRNDLVGVNGRLLQLMLQQPDGIFAVKYRITGLTDAVDITAGDVNGDALPDLYLVQGRSGGSNAPDRMLLNKGNGYRYTSMTIPQTTVGAGDWAVPLDYDGNGLEDFLVMNGRPYPIRGPVQLIAFFPGSTS